MKILKGATHKYKPLFKNVWGVFSRYVQDLIRCNKGVYLAYQDYNKKVVFLDAFYFQQNTRKQSIRNLKPVFYLSKQKNNHILTGVLIVLCLITPFTNWAIPYIIIKARKGGFKNGN